VSVDRVACAMTGGRPRAEFTARVMAPIYGRPRPGFTDRVVAVAHGFSPANAPVGRGFSPGFWHAFLLIPAALALAAGVMVARASRVDLPPAPAAPTLATAMPVAQAPEVAQVFRPVNAAPAAQALRPATRQAQRPAPADVAPSEPAPIYMIPALESPDDIAMKPIETRAVALTPLAAPAPLTVPSLDGSKEKS